MDSPRRRTSSPEAHEDPSHSALRSRTARPEARGEPAEQQGPEAEAGRDSDWIYRELGLSASAYKGDPAALPRSTDFGYDEDLRADDPHDSPFPPGSLGGGIVDPPTRPFEGFPPSGAGLPAGTDEPSAEAEAGSDPATDEAAAAEPAEESTAPTAETPSPATAAPPTQAETVAGRSGDRSGADAPGREDTEIEDNPFHSFDSRTRSGELPMPAPAPRPATAGVPRSPRRPEAILPAEGDRITSDSLTADKVLKQRKTPPTTGWRKGLLTATGGMVNLGPSSKELRTADFEARVRTPIQGCHRLAVISLKGGVGKTTTAAALGSMFASLRGDRVVAIDANPDRGTLGDKIVAGQTQATVRDFVARSQRLDRYSAVRELTAQADSRLEVLLSESDPLASMAFSENDYRVISDVLERFYNLILTDCGTGLLHSAMVGVLAKAEQVVIVSSASLDGARSASATLDWLEAHNYGELARESVTVVTSVRPQASTVHLQEIVGHFARRTRAVVAVPYDSHLAEGGQIDLDRLGKDTYQAYLELAAEVGDAFGRIPGG